MLIYELPAAPRGFEDSCLFAGDAFAFRQNWNARPESQFRPAHVRFGWRSDALWLYAELEGEGTTTAQLDNQELWILGDVLELFVARAAEQDYRELHVSPTGLTLQLLFPDPDAIRELRQGKLQTQHFVSDCGWHARTRRHGNGWHILAKVPLHLSAGARLHLACGRYDYSSGAAVISNTAPLAEADFHRRQEWHRAVLSASSPITDRSSL